MDTVAAVIVDIVGSRDLDDRAGAQRAVQEAFSVAERDRAALERLHPTVGDEFQAVYATPADAVAVTTIAMLTLPEGIEVRAGIGVGEVVPVAAEISDGSAWWRAREAIEEAHRREDAGHGAVRSWCVRGDEDNDHMTSSVLLLRDHVIARMKARERRIAVSLLQGQTQQAIAADEGISQAAVSQSAHRSGAIAVREALRAMGASA